MGAGRVRVDGGDAMSTVKELVLKYYPVLWPLERIKALVAAEKLTTEEYREITGEAYSVK